jgi:hypothetical protein
LPCQLDWLGLLGQVGDHFRVAIAGQNVPSVEKALAYLSVVVDLTVEDRADRSLLGCHWRISGHKVDHGKAGLADNARTAPEQSTGVRTAVLQQAQLALYLISGNTRSDGTRYAAHDMSLTA